MTLGLVSGYLVPRFLDRDMLMVNCPRIRVSKRCWQNWDLMSAIPRALPTCCGAVPPFRPGPALQVGNHPIASSSRMQSMNMLWKYMGLSENGPRHCYFSGGKWWYTIGFWGFPLNFETNPHFDTFWRSSKLANPAQHNGTSRSVLQV